MLRFWGKVEKKEEPINTVNDFFEEIVKVVNGYIKEKPSTHQKEISLIFAIIDNYFEIPNKSGSLFDQTEEVYKNKELSFSSIANLANKKLPFRERDNGKAATERFKSTYKQIQDECSKIPGMLSNVLRDRLKAVCARLQLPAEDKEAQYAFHNQKLICNYMLFCSDSPIEWEKIQPFLSSRLEILLKNSNAAKNGFKLGGLDFYAILGVSRQNALQELGMLGKQESHPYLLGLTISKPLNPANVLRVECWHSSALETLLFSKLLPEGLTVKEPPKTFSPSY